MLRRVKLPVCFNSVLIFIFGIAVFIEKLHCCTCILETITVVDESTSAAPNSFPLSNEPMVLVHGEYRPLININTNDQNSQRNSSIRTCMQLLLKEVMRRKVVGKNLNKQESRLEVDTAMNRLKNVTKYISDDIIKLLDDTEELRKIFPEHTDDEFDEEGQPITNRSRHGTSPTKNVPAPVVKKEDTEESNIVPILLIIILCLFFYIGYLWYGIKTRYNRSSRILIEDDL